MHLLIKGFWIILCCCYSITTTLAQTIVIDNRTYRIDTLAHFKAGPGSYYTSLRLMGSNRLDVYFLKVDATHPHVTFKAALGRDSIYSGEQPSAMARRKSREGAMYFAGTNGDFYVTAGFVGYPVGGCMVESEIARIPSAARKVVAFDEQKLPSIGAMSYSGVVKSGNNSHTIDAVNHLREANQLVLFNQHNGRFTRTNAFGTEVLIELLPGVTWGANRTLRAKVLQVQQNRGSMLIPRGMAVLSGHGTAATFLNTWQVNDEIELSLNLTLEGANDFYTNIVGGDHRNVMLLNGVVESNLSQIWNELHPRTAIGYSQDRQTVIFCVVDGRGLSAGVTTKQLAELMLSAGAHTAFNMDGGGSSTLYVKEFGPMNVPSDGTERAVANALFAVSTAPTDPVIAEIRSYETNIKLPPNGVFKPKFLAYNQYGFLLNKDLQNVTLSCDPSLGFINDAGELVANGQVSGTLTATWNHLQTQIKITIVPEAEIAIRLDSVIVDHLKGYAIEVQSKIGLNTMTVLPSALRWDVEHPDICRVESGVLYGLKNGRTILRGSLGNFRDSILVIVEIPENREVIAEQFLQPAQWQLSSSLASWNTHFTHNNLPADWLHGVGVRYQFKPTRSPFLKLSRNIRLPGLPDSVKLVLHTGEATFSSIIVGMRAANQTASDPVSFSNLSAGATHTLGIPIARIASNPNDRQSYPLYFEYITMYLNSSQHIADRDYQIHLKEIALVYAQFTTQIPIHQTESRYVLLPNPVNGNEILLSVPSGNGLPLSARLYCINGQLHFQKDFPAKQTKYTLPIQQLQRGHYLVRVTQGWHTETLRFIRN